MENMFSDESFMLVFRTYWPVITILIALLVYLIKQRRERNNLKVFLGWELFNNLTHIHVCLPKRIKQDIDDVDDLFEAVKSLSYSTKVFSNIIYDKLINTMGILSNSEKRTVFYAYSSFSIISALGEEIQDLLVLENRSKTQSEQLVKKSIAFYQTVQSSLPGIEKAVKIFGYGEKHFDILNTARDSVLENINKFEV